MRTLSGEKRGSFVIPLQMELRMSIIIVAPLTPSAPSTMPAASANARILVPENAEPRLTRFRPISRSTAARAVDLGCPDPAPATKACRPPPSARRPAPAAVVKVATSASDAGPRRLTSWPDQHAGGGRCGCYPRSNAPLAVTLVADRPSALACRCAESPRVANAESGPPTPARPAHIS